MSVLLKKSVDLKVSLAEPSISGRLQEFLECFSRYEFDRLCGLDLDLWPVFGLTPARAFRVAILKVPKPIS